MCKHVDGGLFPIKFLQKAQVPRWINRVQHFFVRKGQSWNFVSTSNCSSAQQRSTSNLIVWLPRNGMSRPPCLGDRDTRLLSSHQNRRSVNYIWSSTKCVRGTCHRGLQGTAQYAGSETIVPSVATASGCTLLKNQQGGRTRELQPTLWQRLTIHRPLARCDGDPSDWDAHRGTAKLGAFAGSSPVRCFGWSRPLGPVIVRKFDSLHLHAKKAQLADAHRIQTSIDSLHSSSCRM